MVEGVAEQLMVGGSNDLMVNRAWQSAFCSGFVPCETCPVTVYVPDARFEVFTFAVIDVPETVPLVEAQVQVAGFVGSRLAEVPVTIMGSPGYAAAGASPSEQTTGAAGGCKHPVA
jgi:hypothetical protein